MSNILELSNVRKEFHTSSSKRPIVAVDNISLKLEKGKTLGIVGESGSGKSTLGRLMLRLIEPSAGEIKFDDVNLLNLKNTELRKMRSKMPQKFRLLRDFVAAHIFLVGNQLFKNLHHIFYMALCVHASGYRQAHQLHRGRNELVVFIVFAKHNRANFYCAHASG